MTKISEDERRFQHDLDFSLGLALYLERDLTGAALHFRRILGRAATPQDIRSLLIDAPDFIVSAAIDRLSLGTDEASFSFEEFPLSQWLCRPSLTPHMADYVGRLWFAWPEEAIATVEQVTRCQPGNAEAWTQLARWAGFSMRTDIATIAGDHAVALAPALPSSHAARGCAMAGSGRFTEARESFAEAVRLGAGREEHIGLGWAMIAAGQAKAAEEWLVGIEDGVSPRPRSWRSLALLAQGKVDEAASLLAVEDIVGSGDCPIHMYSNLALCLVAAGRLDEASACLADLCRLEPPGYSSAYLDAIRPYAQPHLARLYAIKPAG